VGCVVTPGFEYEDFELADRETLEREFPGAADIVQALT
jgi:predicted cupin superfamily sugar epimerase